MIMEASPDSIAVFGSVARGDRDQMSDRDILIVSDDDTVRRSSALRLRRKGWSPVVFSWRRLEKAGVRKGLFIQHLKLESAILRDRDHRFQDFLDRFSAKAAYEDEAEEARTLLGVLQSVPNSIKGRYWALDVLWVGFRSLAVATLANHGIYRFSVGSILSGLRQIGLLNSSDVAMLRRMREFKWRYRSQNFERDISLREAQRYVDLVSRRFGIGLHVKAIQAEEAIALVDNEKGMTENWYLQSRLLERGLLGLKARPKTDVEILNAKCELDKLLKEPSQYGWKFKQQWGELNDQLRLVAAYSDVCF